MKIEKRPIALFVLDGWGYREDPADNAILNANTPFWDSLWENYPHTLINASAAAVGLPSDQMGNSEVGHLNLGAGRVVYQEFSRISMAISNGEFEHNPVLSDSMDKAISAGKAVHIIGLLSDGGVHSHEQHIHAAIRMAADKGAEKIYLHAIVDGRDTAPISALGYIDNVEKVFSATGKGRIASVIGRYFALDRDNRWDRVEKAYELFSNGQHEYTAPSARAAMEAAYERKETDEFTCATAIVDEQGDIVQMEDGDAIVFMNFRADRARQLTASFIMDEFEGFTRSRHLKGTHFVSLTEYNAEFGNAVAFKPEKLTNVFGEYISNLGLKQLRIAETEKYAHVTFFLNGGLEQPFPGEDRLLVNSPQVATYDLQPEMNAPELTDRLIERIDSGEYDVIICNFANPDMVGHSGNYEATIKAIETLDGCLQRVITAIQQAGGEALITADHGNAEMMTNPQTQQAHTAHTTNPVPFIYVGRKARVADSGALSDVTPTMLYLMGIDKPTEMTGQSLVELQQ